MRTLVLVVACAAISQPAVSADTAALQPGAYEVEVRLELPHIDDVHTRKIETVCLTASAGETYGLVVLSSNNPLARCPKSRTRREGGELRFDIVCPGVNQARGWASYRLARDAFLGRIEMKMGGKNMTMTEVQTGHRIGGCSAPGTGSHS